ncbi:MAG: hypothetical protein ACK5MV_14145 [Aminipila sp.]
MIECGDIKIHQQEIDNITFRWRFLWQQISAWLREYMVVRKLKGNTEYLSQVNYKILSIINEFGSIMRIFFGDEAADKFIKIFTDYIMSFINLIDALAEENISKANEAVEQIYKNIGIISEYLFSINPFWDKVTLEKYLYTFTSMTIQEINTFMSGDYKNSIEIFDRILNYSFTLGDFFAQGAKKYLTYNVLILDS